MPAATYGIVNVGAVPEAPVTDTNDIPAGGVSVTATTNASVAPWLVTAISNDTVGGTGGSDSAAA